jgi:MoxR-like ATPase
MESSEIQKVAEEVKKENETIGRVFHEMEKVMVGQVELIERMLIGIIANGHILVEGVPGLAKTTAVKTLARVINTGFRRIQFTPDLLPADLTGTQIYLPATGQFTIKKGPIFSNIILADEINRAPAKVQSALLEAMQERQVTIGETTLALAEPFLVMATQNPIEQEGTYPLPEAQVDRFMLKIKVNYPNREEELKIMERISLGGTPEVETVISPADILRFRQVANRIYIDEKLKGYIVDLVLATRDPQAYKVPDLKRLIQYGVSPRASIYLNQVARAYAFLRGRGYVTPQDVKIMAPDIFRHRLILSYEAEAEELDTDDVIRTLLDNIEVP